MPSLTNRASLNSKHVTKEDHRVVKKAAEFQRLDFLLQLFFPCFSFSLIRWKIARAYIYHYLRQLFLFFTKLKSVQKFITML